MTEIRKQADGWAIYIDNAFVSWHHTEDRARKIAEAQSAIRSL